MNLSRLAAFLSPSGELEKLLPWWLPIDAEGGFPIDSSSLDDGEEFAEAMAEFYRMATMVTTQSGGLLRCAAVRWRDKDADPLEDLRDHHDDIAKIVGRYGDGWRIGFDLIRLREPAEAGECAFGGNQAARMVDESIRAQFTERDTFHNSTFLFVHLLPAGRDMLLAWMYGDKRIDVSREVRWFDEQSRALLGDLGYHAESIDILTGDDLATYLAFTGSYRAMAAAMPAAGTLCSQLKGPPWYNRSWNDPKVRIGDRRMATVEVHDYAVTNPHVLAPVLEAPCELRIVAVYEGLSPETREEKLKKLGNAWMTKRMTGRGLFQAVALRDQAGTEKNRRAYEADDVIQEMRAKPELYPICDGWMHVHTWGDTRDEADANAAEIVRRFGSRKVISAQATLTDFNALASSIPGLVGKEDNVRKAGLLVPALARLMPATGCDAGHAKDAVFGPRPLTLGKKRNGMPYRFVLNTPGNDLSNIFAFGKSGSGKSAMIGRLASQFLGYGGFDAEGEDADSCVVIVDREESALVNCMCHGGQWFEVGGGGLGVQPLRYIDEPDERSRAFDHMLGMLEFVGVTHKEEPRLREVINRGFDFVAKMPRDERTITKLHGYCSDSLLVQRGLNNFRRGHGPYGRQFDCVVKDADSSARFVVFETFSLDRQKHAHLLIASLWWWVERNFINGRRPALLALDEVAELMKLEAWRSRIESTARTIRKRQACFLLASQDPRHLHGPGGGALLAQMATKIYMPDKALKQPDNAKAYLALGVQPHLIWLAANARQKDQALVARDLDGEAHLISWRMEGAARRICAASSPADRARCRDILERGVEPGESFLYEWLRETTEEWRERVGYRENRKEAA